MTGYSSSCGISNLSVNPGDEVGLVFLEKQKYTPARSRLGQGAYISESEIYEAFLPPIFGTYDDTGSLSNIASSKTVEIYESIFNKPIEKIADCISRRDGVYQANSAIFTHFFPWNRLDSGAASDEILFDDLVSLGFGYEQQDEYDEYFFGDFSFQYKSQNDDRGIINGSGIISNIVDEKYLIDWIPITDLADFLEVFGNATNVYPGFLPEDYERISLLNRLEGMFFHKDIFDGMNEFFDMTFPNEKIKYKKSWDELMDLIELEEQNNVSIFSEKVFKEFYGLGPGFSLPMRPYIHELKKYGKTYDFYQLWALTCAMFYLNRMLLPSFHGASFGYDEAAEKFHELSGVIVEKRKIQREKAEKES